MNNKFYCNTCGISFPSWMAMKEHFQSKEHKDRASKGNVELLLDRFTKHFKEFVNESNKIRKISKSEES